MSQYFMMIGGVRFGPMTPEDLIRKGLNRDSLVWKEGMADYLPAHQVPELATLPGGLPPPTPTTIVTASSPLRSPSVPPPVLSWK